MANYKVKNILDKSPIQITAAILSIVNLGVLMNWYTLTGDQVAGLNTALFSVLGLFIVSKTSNKAVLQEMADAQEEAA